MGGLGFRFTRAYRALGLGFEGVGLSLKVLRVLGHVAYDDGSTSHTKRKRGPFVVSAALDICLAVACNEA